MTQPLVTILVPHYKTLELTKLCLRLLRKYTDLNKARVIVIDNDSQDESLSYLRSLNWIQLMERKAVPGESPPLSHGRALDMGLAMVTTPYVLSIHTDTLVKHPKWLEFLLTQIEKNPSIAGVGSWKLEAKPRWRQMLKMIERGAQRAYFRVIGQTQHSLEGVGKNYYYLRSHCALYRTTLLKQYQLHFSDGVGEELVVGKEIHKRLLEAGHEIIFLPSEILIRYLEHINHATMVLNPQLGSRQKSIDKGLRRIERSLACLNAQAILQDGSLDA